MNLLNIQNFILFHFISINNPELKLKPELLTCY
jgi:hypothetical protein